MAFSTLTMSWIPDLRSASKHLHRPEESCGPFERSPPRPLSPAPGNHQRAFHLHGFACSGRFHTSRLSRTVVGGCLHLAPSSVRDVSRPICIAAWGTTPFLSAVCSDGLIRRVGWPRPGACRCFSPERGAHLCPAHGGDSHPENQCTRDHPVSHARGLET